MKQPTIYIGAHYSDSQESTIYALEAQNGAEVWHHSAGNRGISSPVFYDAAVYFSIDDGSIIALRANDGSALWQQQRETQFSRLALANWTVYVSANDGTVYAFDTKDGSPRWQQTVGDLLPARPVVAGKRIYVRSKDGAVHALSADDGVVLWSAPVAAGMFMTATENVVYTRHDNGGVSALRASDGFTLWHRPTEYPGTSNPTIGSGIVYLSGNNGVDALRANDGYRSWRYRTQAVTTPAVMDGLLYAASSDEDRLEVYALRINTGRLAWRWHTPTSGKYVTNPLAANEVVYIGIGDNSGLYALRGIDGCILWHTLDGRNVTAASAGERT